jgi:hypothetical protein
VIALGCCPSVARGLRPIAETSADLGKRRLGSSATHGFGNRFRLGRALITGAVRAPLRAREPDPWRLVAARACAHAGAQEKGPVRRCPATNRGGGRRVNVEETVRWAELEAEAARGAAAEARRAQSREQARDLARGLERIERVRPVAVIGACARHKGYQLWDCADCWGVQR